MPRRWRQGRTRSTTRHARRSASLCLNLIATWLDVNEATLPPPGPVKAWSRVELAVQVENAYVGSPLRQPRPDHDLARHRHEKQTGTRAPTLYEPGAKKDRGYIPLGAGRAGLQGLWHWTRARTARFSRSRLIKLEGEEWRRLRRGAVREEFH